MQINVLFKLGQNINEVFFMEYIKKCFDEKL